jgi:hypothetical protein
MWFDQENKLAKELTKLPPPPIPRDLETRLLRTMPHPAALRAEPKRFALKQFGWSLALPIGGTIAALAAFAVIALRGDRERPITTDVSPRYIQPPPRIQETRPCDVLPPLPRPW